jgi:caa(3)-type oxidase subunit IV
MTTSTEQMHETEPSPSGRALVITLVALLVLTAISWAIAHLALGAASIPVALAIATVKAGFVVTAFMELRRASTTSRIVALVTVVFIALLSAGTVTDIALR